MTHKRKIWTFSDHELLILTLALQADIESLESGSGAFTDGDRQGLIAKRKELAARINEIRHGFRKDVDPDGMWSERDQIVVKIVLKPGDELYEVVPWGPDRWVIVEKANPGRPVNEHIYTQYTHAHRKKRELNKAARHMNEIMAANGGALIL